MPTGTTAGHAVDVAMDQVADAAPGKIAGPAADLAVAPTGNPAPAIQILPFAPATATREEWARFHAFRRVRHAESSPEDPVGEDATVEQWIHKFDRDPEEANIRWQVVLADQPDVMVGEVDYTYRLPAAADFATTGHGGWGGISLVAPMRRHGIGRRLLRLIYDAMATHGQRLMISATTEPDGMAFLDAIGAERALEGGQNRLQLPDVDWAMVERWVAEGPARAPGARLELFERVPDEILEAYCAFYTEVENQQPMGTLDTGHEVHTPEARRRSESDFGALGATRLTAVLHEPDGVISGLSEIFYEPDDEHLAFQWLTGVRASHRGAGRGKWLKAAMLQVVRERFPQVTTIATGNATSNAPMLAINWALGFKPHRRRLEAQMTHEALGDYLRRHGLLEG